MITRHLTYGVFILTVLAGSAGSDSIFDADGTGRDVIPAAGETRGLGGAVVATKDPLSCSITGPFGSAYADKITLSAGFAHTGTTTDILGEEKQTVTSLFPSITVIVPLKKLSVMTGLFLEKEGRVSLTMTDLLYGYEYYDIHYRRETSVHSVPVFLSAALHRKVTVSGGIIVSFMDIREKTVTDFRTLERSDAEDVYDTYAMGESFAAGFLLDLDRIRFGVLLRSGTDLNGRMESENSNAGIWASEDISITSGAGFSAGICLTPAQQVSFEVDYLRSPWADLEIGDTPGTGKTVERWAVGVKYMGNHLWEGARYPLIGGYYRQPLDSENDIAGEITEEVFSIGTSVPIGRDMAKFSLAFEMGRRQGHDSDDLHETMYGFSLSVSAMEAWRREIRR